MHSRRWILVTVVAVALISQPLVLAVDFVRGDANQDLKVDLADAATILAVLFQASQLDCVDAGDTNNPGGLPKVKGQQGWLRDPQQFPVIIAVEEGFEIGLLRSGGQVDVVVYTGNNRLINTVARGVLRVRSWLSYVR